MSSERVSGEIHGVLDLLQMADAAEAAGHGSVADSLRQDAEEMIDQGNATTYFEEAFDSSGLDQDHPDYEAIKSIAEKCALNGMRHARMERAERNNRPEDGLQWFAVKLESKGE